MELLLILAVVALILVLIQIFYSDGVLASLLSLILLRTAGMSVHDLVICAVVATVLVILGLIFKRVSPVRVP